MSDECRKAFEEWTISKAHRSGQLKKDVQTTAAWAAWQAAWNARNAPQTSTSQKMCDAIYFPLILNAPHIEAEGKFIAWTKTDGTQTEVAIRVPITAFRLQGPNPDGADAVANAGCGTEDGKAA